MKGYWNNDDATKESIDDDGWYHTGDVGRFDNGYLMITDRIKHMIVSKGGKNIYPGPIEDGFKTESMIDQVMVVGEGREYLTALVVLAEDAATKVAGSEDPFESEAVADYLKKFFRAYSREAAAHEKIRDFRLVREAFTVDNGLMTPTLKLRRKAIEKEYAPLIDSMYAHVV
jgi:long-chain acyl-CoA synthetase